MKLEISEDIITLVGNAFARKGIDRPNDPRHVNAERKQIIAASIATLVLVKAEELASGGFGPAPGALSDFNRLFKQKHKYNSILLQTLETVYDQEPAPLEAFYSKWRIRGLADLSIGAVYELILDVEWTLSGIPGGIRLQSDKSSRNRAGAYYTPRELADAVVRRSIDTFIEKRVGVPYLSQSAGNMTAPTLHEVRNTLENMSVIDLSCGTGVFLLSILDYVTALQMSDTPAFLRKVALNLWGVDVDHIAMEIAVFEIALYLNDIELFKELQNHFVHGNPLMMPPSDDYSSKVALSESGFIYHPELGVQLPNRSFDLVVGNPPWEKIRFEDKAFFKSVNPDIAASSKKDERSSAITDLARTAPSAYKFYIEFKSALETSKKLIVANARLKYSISGELNTYALFTELATSYVKDDGVIGLVVKTALVTSPVNSGFFRHLINQQMVISINDFVNKRRIFRIDSRERFSVIILGSNPGPRFSVVMNLETPDQLANDALPRPLLMDRGLLEKVNPLTLSLPNVEHSDELSFLIKTASNNADFDSQYPDAKFGRLVHFTNHAGWISREGRSGYLPIYEGKFINQYDGRYSTFEGMQDAAKYASKSRARLVALDAKTDPGYVPMPRYYIEESAWLRLTRGYNSGYSLMWRSLTSASNVRSCIATILPHMPTSQSIQFLQLKSNRSLGVLLAVFNSVIFDYAVRLKLNGIDLTQTIIRQIPVPSLLNYRKPVSYKGYDAILEDHILARVNALLNGDDRLNAFRSSVDSGDTIFDNIDVGEPKIIMAELDELVSLAYGLNRYDLLTVLKQLSKYRDIPDVKVMACTSL